MLEVEIVGALEDPPPIIQAVGKEREAELRIVEMGLVELLVFVPIQSKIVELYAGDKIIMPIDRDEQAEVSVVFPKVKVPIVGVINVRSPDPEDIAADMERMDIPVGKRNVFFFLPENKEREKKGANDNPAYSLHLGARMNHRNWELIFQLS